MRGPAVSLTLGRPGRACGQRAAILAVNAAVFLVIAGLLAAVLVLRPSRGLHHFCPGAGHCLVDRRHVHAAAGIWLRGDGDRMISGSSPMPPWTPTPKRFAARSASAPARWAAGGTFCWASSEAGWSRNTRANMVRVGILCTAPPGFGAIAAWFPGYCNHGATRGGIPVLRAAAVGCEWPAPEPYEVMPCGAVMPH
jgi:hypothetical protein